jgi:group I intron endonuclease
MLEPIKNSEGLDTRIGVVEEVYPEDYLKGPRLTSGIYEIRNKLNGKRYVGSAKNIFGRWKKHKNCLVRNEHNVKLQNAWNKYGESAFEFNVILWCAVLDLIRYEQLFIDGYDTFKNGYNACPTAGSSLGFKHSEETKALLRGRPSKLRGTHQTLERRLQTSVALAGRVSPTKGKLRSVEVKLHDSIVQKKWNKEHPDAKIGEKNPFYGHHHTEETIALLRAANTGHVCSLETRNKLSLAGTGRVVPEEVCQKHSRYKQQWWDNRKLQQKCQRESYDVFAFA